MKPPYIPNRNDIIWLDFEPTKGSGIGKYRPVLVLSSQAYNLEKASVVAASLIQTLSWQNRQAKFITRAEPGIMDDVLLRLIPLIGADKLIEKIVNEAS